MQQIQSSSSILILLFLNSCNSMTYKQVVLNYLQKHSQSTLEILRPSYIKPSLFPNVSPYINFVDFDLKLPIKIPREIRETLIWRRSPEITCGGFQAHFILNLTGISTLNGTRDKNNDWFGYWHGTNVCRVPTPPIFTKPYQKYNFFGATEQLGQKDLQCLNLRRLINKHMRQDFSFYIETFILPREYSDFKEAWLRNENKLWIIKPHQGYLSKGVHLIDHWSQVAENTGYTTVQKYLHSPYLLRGKKFELRLFVLATSFNPLRIFRYSEGITKVSYKNFTADPKYKDDPCIHIRVNHPAKECPEAVISKDFHNERFFAQNTKIFEKLRKQGRNVKKLQDDLDDAIIKTMISVDSLVDSANRKIHFNRYNGFQIWAFDFLIDSDFKVWLMEVNTIPGLSVETEEDVSLKFPMIQEILNLAGFQFPPTLSLKAKQIIVDSLEKHNFTGDPTFNEKLYTFDLSKSDKIKQSKFMNWKYNSSATEDEDEICSGKILETLSSEDVRQLILAEEELNRTKKFNRIFPAIDMKKYLKYFEESPYYYLLLNAWETRYGNNRSEGIDLLRKLAAEKVHLK